jgi:hypothetical protein
MPGGFAAAAAWTIAAASSASITRRFEYREQPMGGHGLHRW